MSFNDRLNQLLNGVQSKADDVKRMWQTNDKVASVKGKTAEFFGRVKGVFHQNKPNSLNQTKSPLADEKKNSLNHYLGVIGDKIHCLQIQINGKIQGFRKGNNANNTQVQNQPYIDLRGSDDNNGAYSSPSPQNNILHMDYSYPYNPSNVAVNLTKDQPSQNRKSIVKQVWFIIVMMIFVAPVGIYLMWNYTNWKRVTKIVVSVVLILYYTSFCSNLFA